MTAGVFADGGQLVTLSEAKGLHAGSEMLRFAQHDRRPIIPNAPNDGNVFRRDAREQKARVRPQNQALPQLLCCSCDPDN